MATEDKFELMNEAAQGSAAPEDLVTRAFARCSNWPKERSGVLGLAQALKIASSRYGVAMEAIVRACADGSTFCPTDADLMNVAKGMAPRKESPAPSVQSRCPEGLCDGSGWRETFTLHTHHGGDGNRAAWVEKTAITREQYEDLSRKVDWKTQQAYSGRYRCACHPARPEELEKRGKYA